MTRSLTSVSLNEILFAAAVIAALAGAVPAQRQFEELPKRHLPVNSDVTNSVALGDVDGDGDLDMVLANSNQQNRLYLNDGMGAFTDTTPSQLPIDANDSRSVAFGDVDGDGDLDIVLGNLGQQNRLYQNDGTGTFTDVTPSQMPVDSNPTRSMAFGDVDGDGDLDIVLANSNQNQLYLNDGTGTFTDATPSQMPIDSDETYSVAFGDVDGDGDLDLILGNGGGYPGQQNRLYLNNGTGVFADATASQIPVDSDATRSLAFGDVDGDGDLDLLFGNYGQQNPLYLNDGMGTFTDATPSQMPVANDATNSVAFGDVDGDGDLDIILGTGFAVPQQQQQNQQYLNDGTGTFRDSTASRMPVDNDVTRSVALADVDGDGDLDIVLGNSAPQNRLYMSDGTGTFRDATASKLPADRTATSSVACGDVDGDGDLDMVIGNLVQNRLHLNDGTGTFRDATPSRMPVGSDVTNSVTLGDLDGDGDLDMVLGNGGQQNRLHLNDGMGTFTDATTTRMPVDTGDTQSVALADVDGDGDLDMVLGNLGQQNRLYLNDGTGTFRDATSSRMPLDSDATRSVALADVDGDGDLDMALGTGHISGQQRQNRLYLNDGTGTFGDATRSQMPVDNADTRSMAFGDVDGDGDLDLVLGNGFGQQAQNRLYQNDATGTYRDATATQMPLDSDATFSVELADVDGDGDLDMVLGNLGQQNRLYLNDGTGTFLDATASRMPVDRDRTGSMAVGDVDGDGDLDLVLGNSPQPNRLYVNLLRQLDAPLLARVGFSFRIDVYARYGQPRLTDVAVPFLSPAPSSITVPGFGTVGIDPAQAISLPHFMIPQPAGVASATFTIPNDPNLVGLPVYAQAILIQNPLRASMTNVTVDAVLR